MRRACLTIYSLLIVSAMASYAVVCTSGCGFTPEPYPVSHALHLFRLHRNAGTVTIDETIAAQEYYDSIGTTPARFEAAKRSLRKIEGDE